MLPHLLSIGRVNDRVVSAFLTPSHHKFLLLHGGRSEESVRSFFQEVHEVRGETLCFVMFPLSDYPVFLTSRFAPCHSLLQLFVKQLCSPFQGMESPILSKAFDDRLRALGRRYLS